MTAARASIVRGPAVVIFGGLTMYTESDISLTPKLSSQPINTSFFGEVDAVDTDAQVDINFTPSGVWAYRTALLPNASRAIGSDIYGSDATCIIHSLAGEKLTFYATALTKMPQLRFAVKSPLFGPVTITAIRKDATAWSTADSLYKVESAAFSDTSFTRASILQQLYTFTYGASPWNAISTEMGVTIDFNVQLTPAFLEETGTCGMAFGGISAVVRFSPRTVTAANMLDLLVVQGTGAGPGTRRSAREADFVVAGTGVAFTLKNCHPLESGVQFGSVTPRPGEIALGTSRSFTTGAMDALFTMGTGA